MPPNIRKAAQKDIYIQQGSTFSLIFSFPTEFLDVSTVDWVGQIRRTHRNNDVMADFAFEVLSDNRLKVKLAPAVTEALTAGELVYDIELHDSGFIQRMFEGRAEVSPEVTKSVPGA